MSVSPHVPLSTDFLTAYSVDETASLLSLSRTSIQRMIRDGSLLAFYPRGQGQGRPVRIRGTEIAAAIDRMTVDASEAVS